MLLHRRLENAPANEKVDSMVIRVGNLLSKEAKPLWRTPWGFSNSQEWERHTLIPELIWGKNQNSICSTDESCYLKHARPDHINENARRKMWIHIYIKIKKTWSRSLGSRGCEWDEVMELATTIFFFYCCHQFYHPTNNKWATPCRLQDY